MPLARVPPFDDALRAKLSANLAAHERWAVESPEGYRRAAVAVVVLDSDSALHGDDPNPAPPERLEGIPGAEGYPLTGSVAGTAGGGAGGVAPPQRGVSP